MKDLTVSETNTVDGAVDLPVEPTSADVGR